MADQNDISARLQARETKVKYFDAAVHRIDTNNDKVLDGTELLRYALDEYQQQHKNEKNPLAKILANITLVRKQWKEKAPIGSQDHAKAEEAKASLYEIIRDIPSHVADGLKEVPQIVEATAQLGQARAREQQAIAEAAEREAGKRQVTAEKAMATVQARVDVLGELRKKIESGALQQPDAIGEAVGKILSAGERRTMRGPAGYTRQNEHKDGPGFDDLLAQAKSQGMTPELKQQMLQQLETVQHRIAQAGQAGASIIAAAPVTTPEASPVSAEQVARENEILNYGRALLAYKVDPSQSPATLDNLEQLVKARLEQQHTR